MDLRHKSRTEIVFACSPDELASFTNALNEVCHGFHIDDAEFSARLGINREALSNLLSVFSAALDAPSTQVV